MNKVSNRSVSIAALAAIAATNGRGVMPATETAPDSPAPETETKPTAIPVVPAASMSFSVPIQSPAEKAKARDEAKQTAKEELRRSAQELSQACNALGSAYGRIRSAVEAAVKAGLTRKEIQKELLTAGIKRNTVNVTLAKCGLRVRFNSPKVDGMTNDVADELETLAAYLNPAKHRAPAKATPPVTPNEGEEKTGEKTGEETAPASVTPDTGKDGVKTLAVANLSDEAIVELLSLEAMTPGRLYTLLKSARKDLFDYVAALAGYAAKDKKAQGKGGTTK